MMKIIIFRHGEKQEEEPGIDIEINRSVCLSEKGINQIKTLGETLYTNYPEFIGLPYIHSSSFPRAIQSAEIVRNILSIKEIKTDILFQEIYAFKDYSQTKEQRIQMHDHAIHNLDHINETGYSYKQKAQSLLAYFKEQFEKGVTQLLISGHGALIRSMLLTLYPEVLTQYRELKMPEGGYVMLIFDGSTFKILSHPHM